MNSSDEALDEDEQGGVVAEDSSRRWNKHKMRACDRCRKKKVRCDGGERPGVRCTNCVTSRTECTFGEHVVKRGPPKGYIRDLEKRCEALEKLLSLVAPNVDVAKAVGPSFNQDSWSDLKASGRIAVYQPTVVTHEPPPPLPAESVEAPTRSPSVAPPSPILNPTHYPHQRFGLPVDAVQYEDPQSLSPTLLTDSDEGGGQGKDDLTTPLERQLAYLNLNGLQRRYHGKASTVHLVQAALNMTERMSNHTRFRPTIDHMRFPYLKPGSWEITNFHLPDPSNLKFPPSDLAELLVDLAFKHVFSIYPLLHRPTFEQRRKNGLHLRSIPFARIYLMVCAVGARHSSEDRTCYKDKNGQIEWGSAGWKYFSQVLDMRWPILAPSTLPDLQVMAMMSLYLQNRAVSRASWIVCGMALRGAIDIGLHREKAYRTESSFNTQMWKRVFWVLIVLDRATSTIYGRQIMIADDEMDVPLPLEVDDEYYDEARDKWEQPENKPAIMSAFIAYIKLMGIQAQSLQNLYSINKRKMHKNEVGDEYDSQAVCDLNSQLNSWINTLPPHLVYDSKTLCDATFYQSAYLRLIYHWVQTTIHRPFLPSISLTGSLSPLAFPSLTICTTSSRAASHIVEALLLRGFLDEATVSIAFAMAIVLLVCMCASQQQTDLTKPTQDLQRYTAFLSKAQNMFYLSGRFSMIVRTIASYNNIHLREPVEYDESLDTGWPTAPNSGLHATGDSLDPATGIPLSGSTLSHPTPGSFPESVTYGPTDASDRIFRPGSIPSWRYELDALLERPSGSNFGGLNQLAAAATAPSPLHLQQQSTAPHYVPPSAIFGSFRSAPANISQAPVPGATPGSHLTSLFGPHGQNSDDWSWFHQMLTGDQPPGGLPPHPFRPM